jgi:hypothetical protein
LFPLVLLVGLAGCESQAGLDLAADSGLYQELGYRAQHLQQRSYWLMPFADRRRPLPTHRDGIYPVQYTMDNDWQRPVTTMLDEVLAREIETSHIFASRAASEAEADWLIEPLLLSFHGGIEERIASRMARGVAAFWIRVHGPHQAGGDRPVVRSQEFSVPVEAEGMLVLPDPHTLAAASLRRTLAFVLLDLDQGGAIADGAREKASPAAPTKVDWSAAPATGKRDR